MNKKKELEGKLVVGTKVRIGKECSQVTGLDNGQVIEFIKGFFDEENGLYTETVTAPSIRNEAAGDFDSIYHLFGNDLEDFLDSEIL